ncbi:MAG TPA: PEGA domain-containing protein, partial [Vicinamibacterales bacterium]|nr:PEGA domain-containing protein [Vicinamibacterales bacterium]
MASAAAIPYLSGALLYCDGLGERIVTSDPATGELLQVLLLKHELGGARSFEFALRERTARLSSFRHASYAPVYRIDRVPSSPPRLAVVSAHVEGTRLSDLLRTAHEQQLQMDISAALCVIQQLAPAVALLHGHASDVAHGLIAPERLVVSPSARLVIVEQVLAGAIEQMQYGRELLWGDLRIAAPTGAGPVCLDRNADLAGVGLVALALLLGRPLQDDEFPARIGTLLDEARERTALGYERRLSQPLHDWIARLLQIESYDGFRSAAEACAAFEDVVVGDPHYLPAPIALEMFLSRCAAALLEAAPEDERPASAPPTTAPETAIEALHPARMTLAVPDLHHEPSEAAPSGEPDWMAVTRQPAVVATSLEMRDLLGAPDLPGLDDGLPPPVHDLSESKPSWPSASPGPPRRLEILRVSQSWAARLNRPEFKRRGAAATVMILVLCAGTVIARVVRGDAAAFPTASGTLVVNSNPAGLQVLIDGIDRGRTPARVSLRAGAHALEVRGSGGPRQVEVDVPAGAEVSQHFEFAVPVMTGALQVNSQPERAAGQTET